ncbi:MAG TPA: YggS family pyridoxal phosphate-dependent enzyme [Candidatus Faecousia intestinigallinarum]|nr:YggS family pyridoxal phosphate-dependent enzyme [Candidatus Faecousia intestinigallinarum]
MSIAENIAAVRMQIARAAAAAGRDPGEIQLCAATKMNDAQAVRQAIAAGVDCCGENRVQELVEKQRQDAYRGAPVHFIGHLQTNKVRQVVGKVDLIQSVDSLRLLQAIDAEAARQGIRQDILLEVNTGREESKSGFYSEDIPAVLEVLPNFSHIFLRGLMTIPPVCQEPEDSKEFFLEICRLSVDIGRKKYDNVSVDILSMGMSGDYAEAIACGSTMIRLGTAIFGSRNYGKSHQE